jgi:hypothetical protein
MNGAPVVTAFLDANVLYPALLRDILMHLASRDLFRARWSAQVHDEWMAALIRDRPDIPLARLERTRHLMDAHFQDAPVEGYEHRMDSLVLPDPDDRHVLAAAIHCGADTIVTTNLRDFPDAALSGFGLQAIHPDAFIRGLFDRDSNAVIDAMRRLRLSFRNPPRSAPELLAAMKARGLTVSADALGGFVDAL